jgi:hypothetical protein
MPRTVSGCDTRHAQRAPAQRLEAAADQIACARAIGCVHRGHHDGEIERQPCPGDRQRPRAVPPRAAPRAQDRHPEAEPDESGVDPAQERQHEPQIVLGPASQPHGAPGSDQGRDHQRRGVKVGHVHIVQRQVDQVGDGQDGRRPFRRGAQPFAGEQVERDRPGGQGCRL